MGQTTGITWCDHTFNPWIGCQRVSPGCEHCYAEAMAKRAPALVYGPQKGQGGPRTHLTTWGPQAPRRVTSAANWAQPLRWNRAAEKAGARRRVFCASLSDVFEDNRPASGAVGTDDLDGARGSLWALIEQCPALDWLLLTKRPQNVLSMVPPTWAAQGGRWPRNVWIGTTAEDRQRAEERLPHLLKVPAAVRFVSYEPALSAVDLRPWLGRSCCVAHRQHLNGHCTGAVDTGIDWLIVGGESGPGARPFDLVWARSALAQCKSAGVPVFVKQLGAKPMEIAAVKTLGGPLDFAYTLSDKKGGDMAEWPADLRVREFPAVSRG